MVRVKGISVGSHIHWSPLEIIVFSSTLYHSLNEGSSTQFMYLYTPNCFKLVYVKLCVTIMITALFNLGFY